MRIFKIVLVLSFIIMSLVVFKLLGTYISLKREVQLPMQNKITEALIEKESYFRDFIDWLWIALAYVIVISIVCFRVMRQMKRVPGK